MPPNRSVSRYAVAPGMMGIAMTRMTPTVWRVTTAVRARIFGFRPIAWAWAGSKA